MYRRNFLGLMGVGATTNLPQIAGSETVPSWVPKQILNRIIRVASTFADQGVEGTMKKFVAMSNKIAPIYLEYSDLFPNNLAAISDTESVLSNNVDAIRSILETINSSLDLGIDGRTAAMFTYASKIGGILLAIGSIGKASVALHRANTVQELSPARIDTEKHQKFGFALLGLCIELSLFVVPFNYRFAWRGTRYFSNRVLYRVQRYLPDDTGQLVHTISMILTHWFQRLGLEIAQGHLYGISNGIEYAIKELQGLSQELDFDSRYRSATPVDSILWTPSEEEILSSISELVQEFPKFTQFLDEGVIQSIES
ncbi:hypothetical protein [Halomicrobium salinisoli]|uniref:hypothetical protein n=1 Tax=Halomicrobium salinisoli TaxID=2878391 RepID=UPI001CEFEFCB|nr:hypothetical protein [Halomicrobium salinisoli]